MLVRVVVVLAIELLVTLPFGFYRAYTRKFSVRWFAAIHVPVLFVILARILAHVPYYYIPLTCAAFAIAQFGGARLGAWWKERRRAARASSGESVSPSLTVAARGGGTA